MFKKMGAVVLSASVMLLSSCGIDSGERPVVAKPPEIPSFSVEEQYPATAEFPDGWGGGNIARNLHGRGGPITPDFDIDEKYLRSTGGAVARQDPSVFSDISIGAPIAIFDNFQSHTFLCTIADIRQHNGEWYAITAGHCFTDMFGYTIDETILTGDGSTYVGALVDTPQYDRPRGIDFAVIKLDSRFGERNQFISGYENYTIRYANPDDLRPGSEICKIGSTTGETCGWVLNKSDVAISANIVTAPGDSGGPVFLKDEDTKTIYLLGIVSSGQDYPQLNPEIFSISIISLL